MIPGGRSFSVDTKPTKTVVVESLTRDASVEASIFDLIDNSIDSAGDDMRKNDLDPGEGTLLESYADYHIDIRMDGSRFEISDDCAGITIADLTDRAFRFGQRSCHDVGIGVFGVGLNRALFKLGGLSRVTTETRTQRAEITWSVDDYLGDDNWSIEGVESVPRGRPGTTITVEGIPEDIAQTFADADWVRGLLGQVGERYGRFLSKGLVIKINGFGAVDLQSRIRDDGLFDPEHKFYKSADDVSIHVRYGQHEKHRFTNEVGYDARENAKLSGQFGWTVICNDRAVLVADDTRTTGWSSFHTEFYGFVGIVEFTCAEPHRLPWSTTKTGIDLNNKAYQLALPDMEKFNEKWRKFTERRKKSAAGGDPIRPIPPRAKPIPPDGPTANPPGPTPRSAPASVARRPFQAPPAKVDHNSYREILPLDLQDLYCFDKLLALVNEAKLLDLSTLPYAGTALIRMLFEASVRHYIRRHELEEAFREYVIDLRTRANPKPLTQRQRNEMVGGINEMMSYLQVNPAIWGAAGNKFLKHSLDRTTKHMSRINGVLHNPFEPLQRTVAFDIRDDLLPILRHLIET